MFRAFQRHGDHRHNTTASTAAGRDLGAHAKANRLRPAETQAGLRRFGRWRNWLTGQETTLSGRDDATLDLQALFAGAQGLPFAVLVADGEAAA